MEYLHYNPCIDKVLRGIRFPMQKSMDMVDLLESLEASDHDQMPNRLSGMLSSPIHDFAPAAGAGKNAPLGGVLTDTGESIFSQLLERIVQGYALKLEDGAEESSASLEILLDGVSDSVLIMSQAGVILEANQAFYVTFGYARGELLGKPIYELLPDAYRGASMSAWRNFLYTAA
jgi:PAS domain-containing protein